MAAKTDARHKRYAALLEAVFLAAHRADLSCVPLTSQAFALQARRLGVSVASIPSLVYEFRHGRSQLPPAMQKLAPKGREWLIEITQDGYRARAVPVLRLSDPSRAPLVALPDRTPAEHLVHGRRDEQWLISRLQHNEVFHHFLGGRVTLLQHHTRTRSGAGQLEIDALLLAQVRGRRDGVVPLQAKNGLRRACVQAQVRQDIEFCAGAYAALEVRPVGIERLGQDQYLLREFALRGEQLCVCQQLRYDLTGRS
jgi:hypothetical protein